MTDTTEIVVASPQQAQIATTLQSGLAPAISERVRFTSKGLELPPDLTIEQAKGLTHYITGQLIANAHEVNLLQLALGQIINHAESKWGDVYTQWLDSTGLAYGTLANAAYVARKVDSSVWNENLWFGHHTAVAPLPPAEQRAWLALAEEEELGANELRRRIQAKRDTDEGRDPAQADIERQLQRIASKMLDGLAPDQWAEAVGKGLLVPLARRKLAADTDERLRLLVDELEEWRWNCPFGGIDRG